MYQYSRGSVLVLRHDGGPVAACILDSMAPPESQRSARGFEAGAKGRVSVCERGSVRYECEELGNPPPNAPEN